METCAYCQSVYKLEESNASIQEEFCSIECELRFQEHEESIQEYLDLEIMDDQIKLSQMIKHLQEQLEKHGDLPVYYSDDAIIGKETMFPKAVKIYSYKSFDMLNYGRLEEKDEDLYDVDLEKPIIKGIII